MSALETETAVTLVIESPRKPARRAALAVGAHTVGASVDCDVVLIDEGVEDQHASIGVDPSGVAVVAAPGARVALRSTSGGKERALGEEPAEWRPGQRLVVGELVINLEPAPGVVLAKAPRRFGRAARFAAPVAAAAAAALYLAAPLVETQFSVAEAAAPARAESEAPALAMAMTAPSVAAPPDEARIRADLAPFGFDPLRIEETAEGWIAEVYVADATLARRLTAVARDLPYPLATTVWTDADLAAATSMVLGNIGAEAFVNRVEQGEAEVEIASTELFADVERRRAIEATLLADVAGLRAVQFQSQIAGDVFALERMIAGVWAGDRPYVALTDGKVVRVGEELADGVGLVSLDGVGRLVLSIDGARHAMELK